MIRIPVTAVHFVLLLALAALWGGSFVFVRVTVGTLGPVVLMALRTSLAAAVLVLYLALVGRLGLVQMNSRIFLVAVLNAAIPFTLTAAAQLQLTVGAAAILNATMPLFAIGVDSIWGRERIDLRRGCGIVLGLAGVALVVGWTPVRPSLMWLGAAGAALFAALSYAAAAIYTARKLEGVPALTLAVGQQLGGAAILGPPAVFLLPSTWPSLDVVAAVLGLAILSTALGFFLYFHLIVSAGPVTAASVTFLIPVFGVLWGVTLLEEPLTSGMIVGLAAILLGVFLVRDAPRADEELHGGARKAARAARVSR